MIKKFNSIEEIQKYYIMQINAYVFKENGEYIDLVVFNFDLDINAHIYANSINAENINVWDISVRDIKALNINAWNINAWDIRAYNNIDALNINAWDIKAFDIKAHDINANDIKADDINANDINADNINYYAVCFAHKNIKCKSIKGRRKNAKHFVLDGTLEVKE